jgi:putative flavoprotein involved in K+ transport
MNKHIETVIVGGGQAGLAVSYYLSQRNRPHIVLEQAERAGNVWRNHRWDSFTLNTPNWQSTLPGAEIPGSSPDSFLSRDEIVAYFENYVSRFQLPVRHGVQVQAVRPKPSGRGYVVETSAGRFDASNVVVATGLYQKPKMPPVSVDLPREIKQIHSDEYRNPQSLPEGAVLVVGSGQSGAQIAEELYQSGRRVYLSVSLAGRVPRRYRGKDVNWWHEHMGDYERTVNQLPSPKAKFASKPMISGKDGGHTLNLHQFARDGVTLLGRLQGVRDHNILLAQDLKANLARADQFEADLAKKIDEFIAKGRIDAPEEALPVLADGYGVREIPELNLVAANITTVIWATGYSFDFSLVQLPIFDGDGYPIQKRGVTDHPGLYFVGLPWLHNARSGLLFGLAQDAGHIASTIDEESQRYKPVRRPPTPAATIRKDESEFAEKVALITGGTSGIGAATALRLASLGAKVVITGRRRLEGRSVAGEIRRRGGSVAFLQTDLSNPEEVRLVVPFTLETFGRLDYAFNNAGISGENRLLVEQTEENFDSVFAVNVKALFLLLQDEVRQMMAQGQGGSIVNAASVSGLLAIPNAGTYAASKHAVLGLTKAAAVEYGEHGIRVNAVSPGAVRTQMLHDVFGSEQAIDKMASVHPLGRIGRPEDVADAVVWLFSDRSSYYTGQSLTLDGGLTALRPSIQQSSSESAAMPLSKRSSAETNRIFQPADYQKNQQGLLLDPQSLHMVRPEA